MPCLNLRVIEQAPTSSAPPTSKRGHTQQHNHHDASPVTTTDKQGNQDDRQWQAQQPHRQSILDLSGSTACVNDKRIQTFHLGEFFLEVNGFKSYLTMAPRSVIAIACLCPAALCGRCIFLRDARQDRQKSLLLLCSHLFPSQPLTTRP